MQSTRAKPRLETNTIHHMILVCFFACLFVFVVSCLLFVNSLVCVFRVCVASVMASINGGKMDGFVTSAEKDGQDVPIATKGTHTYLYNT